jgi:hypothetical protein
MARFRPSRLFHNDFSNESAASQLVFRLLFWEGAFSLAFDTWTGPTYFSGMAGELGVGVGLLSLITVVPWIGAMGQILSLGVYQRSASVRSYVVRLAALCRALWLLPIVAGWYWGVRAAGAHQPFPARKWFLLATGVGAVAQLLGSSSGAAWMSWVRELVSPRVRGRFFGARQRYTMAAVIVVHALGMVWAGWKPGGYPAGYGILLGCALICAAYSTFLLSRVPDTDFGGEVHERKSWIEQVREPLRNPGFRRLVIFNAIFQGTVQLAGPYFPYYYTRELHIPMSSVAFWTVLTNLGWFATATFWGRRIDRVGGSRTAFRFAVNLIALSPLFYVFSGALAVTRIAPLEYFTNGMAWAGYTLVYTKLLLERSPRGKCASYFVVGAVATALASAIGNLMGGQIALWLQPWGGFRALFLVAAVARFGVVWGLGHLMFGRGRAHEGATEHPIEGELSPA